LPLAPHAAKRRTEQQTFHRQLDEQIEKLHEQVREQALQRPGAQLALATEVFLGDTARFANGRTLASYAGMIPSEYSSAGRQRRGGLSKQGNSFLRFLWGEVAMSLFTSFSSPS
jgi:transposase